MNRSAFPSVRVIRALAVLCVLCLIGCLYACRGQDEAPLDTSAEAPLDTSTVGESTSSGTETPGTTGTSDASDAETTETAAPETGTNEPTTGATTSPEENMSAEISAETSAEITVEETTETTTETSEEITGAEESTEVLTLPPEPETEPFDPTKVERLTMPRLDINTDNGQMIQGNNIDKPIYHSSVSLSLCDEAFVLTGVGAEVHVRGNSTAGAAKKPLALKFDEKQTVLGLNRGKTFKSWVLLADYYDETMLRNWTAFKLGDVLLDGQYFSADCAHVEVYINGQYQGVYLLCEKTQIKKNRINIAQKQEDDLTTLDTGYLLIGQGGIWWEENYFDIPIGFDVTDRNGKSQYYGGIRFVLSNGDEYSQAQRDYVSNYCSEVFHVIHSAIYKNIYYKLSRDGTLSIDRELTNDTTLTEAEKQKACVGAVLDLDSAAAMCVLDEIAKNLDAMTFNLYVDLSPEGNAKLTLAAPWDFDHAMAKTHYTTTHSTGDWYATALSESDGVRVNFLTVMLGTTDWFDDMCAQVWQAHYEQIKDTLRSIRVENYQYEEAFERDWDKWGHPLNRGQTGHHTPADLQRFVSHTDSAEFLYDWLERRVKWLNRRWGDGTDVEVVEPSPLLDIDFTDPANETYLSGFRRCTGTIEAGKGLYVTQEEGRDPHFYVDFTGLPDAFEGEDYPYLEITCMVPVDNKMDNYAMELFPCAGGVFDATGGIQTAFDLNGMRGEYCTYRIDLGATGFWDGTIHKIRIDFFAVCEPCDGMYITRVALRTQ